MLGVDIGPAMIKVKEDVGELRNRRGKVDRAGGRSCDPRPCYQTPLSRVTPSTDWTVVVSAAVWSLELGMSVFSLGLFAINYLCELAPA